MNIIFCICCEYANDVANNEDSIYKFIEKVDSMDHNKDSYSQLKKKERMNRPCFIKSKWIYLKMKIKISALL